MYQCPACKIETESHSSVEKLFCDATNSYNFPRDIASVSPREIKRFAHLIIDECNKEHLENNNET